MVESTEQIPAAATKQKQSLWAVWGTFTAGLVLLLSIAVFDISSTLIGALSIIAIVFFILSGIYLGVAILLVSSVSLWTLGGERMLFNSIADVVFDSVANWQYSVVPVFILLGMIVWQSGVSARVFGAARLWFGRLPGGLAVGTTVTGAGLAASSGSTVGIAYAMGRAGIPEMTKAGYRPSLAIGAVSMTGILGQIIPPSIVLVIYAGMVQVPVGPQLLAGVVPGILLTVAISMMIIIRAAISPQLAPRRKRITGLSAREWLAPLSGVVPLLTILGTVIGGLLLGVFTATEAGSVGAVVALGIGLLLVFRDKRSVSGVRDYICGSFSSAVYSTAGIFLLLIGVFLLTRVMTLSRVANDLSDWLLGFGLTATSFMLILIPFYLVLGMFMDTFSMLLITVPVLTPTLVAMEVDLIWFGVYVVILAELAMVTPPLGLLIFIVHRIAVDSTVGQGIKISLPDAFKGALWFVAVSIAVLLLLLAVPELVTWLPSIQG